MTTMTPMTPPAPMASTNARPTGVTILAVLDFIGAGLLVIAGLVAFAGGAFLAAAFGPLGAALGAAIGIFVLILAAFIGISGWGLWTQKAWGWWIALILTSLGALSDVVSIAQKQWSAIVSLAIAAFLFWYLTTPGVERWFGVTLKVPWQKGM